MAKTIGQLTALAATPNAADEFVINDGGVTKKITATNVAAAAWELTGNKSLADTSNIVLGTSTGSKIGTDPLQKLGFYNATPVVQPALTADLLDSLQALGLVASGAGNTPLNLSAGALTAGATTVTSLASTGAVTSSSATAGIGYATGAGGTVTQSSSKSTGVTLDKSTGRITMHNAQLNANTTTPFTLTNSAIAATDLLFLTHISGGTIGAYALHANCAVGSASISVRNVTANNLSEAIVIGFAVIKAVTA